MTDTQREAFEKWVFQLILEQGFCHAEQDAKVYLKRNEIGSYVHANTQLMFNGWQAALAQSQAEKAELVEALEEATLGLSKGLWDYGPGQDEHEQCDVLIEKLRALITKVKGE